jgi:hypothetical protein
MSSSTLANQGEFFSISTCVSGAAKDKSKCQIKGQIKTLKKRILCATSFPFVISGSYSLGCPPIGDLSYWQVILLAYADRLQLELASIFLVLFLLFQHGISMV